MQEFKKLGVHDRTVAEVDRATVLKARATGEIDSIQEGIKNLAPRERRALWRIGRNESCPCGSGKKFKRCCLNKPYDPPAELTLPDAPDEGEVTQGIVNAAMGTTHIQRSRPPKAGLLMAAAALAVGGLR